MTSAQSNKIQCLRGVAIIGVLCIHTLQGWDWQVYVRPFVNYAVALFIFLSGLLTKVENDHWGAFMRKRVLRVLIPYLIWTVFYTLPSQSIKTYIHNLLLTQATPFLYYIFVYIQFVVLTPFLGKLARSKYRWVGFMVAPVTAILYVYAKVFIGFEPHPYVDAIWSASCFGWFGYYYLGLLLGNQLLSVRFKWMPLVVLYFLSILLQMGEGYVWYYGYEALNCGTQVKLTSFLTSFVFLLLSYMYIKDTRIELFPKWLQNIGDCSFGIYLCHGFTMKFLSSFSTWYQELPFGLNTAVVLLVSFVVVALVRRAIGHKWSRYIGFA